MPPDPLAWRDSLTEPRHEAEETQRMRECAGRRLGGRQIASGTPPKEVLVMACKRDRPATMQDALRALHLPCVQPEKSDLFDAPEVQDMVALLDAVSPTHDLSLARALKSPLFGLGDDALVALAVLRRQPEHAGCSWFDLLLKSELLAPDLQALGACFDSIPGLGAAPAAARCAARHLRTWRRAGPLCRRRARHQRQAMQANLRALLAASLQHDGAATSRPMRLCGP